MWIRQQRFFGFLPVLAATAALGLVGCAEGSGARSAGGMDAGGASSTTVISSASEAPIAAALERLGPDVRKFNSHVTTLSNPYFEGRVPGSRGIEVAATYIEHYMGLAGLEPFFGGPRGASFRQPMSVTGETTVDEASFEVLTGGGVAALMEGEDFNALGVSGSGEVVDAPVAFVGYSIEEGPHGYSSYGEGADLTGKAALVLRFEPMSASGQSLWSDQGRWSNNASLQGKMDAAFERGAAAVILVNAPGADDPRAERLEDVGSVRFRSDYEQPVVTLSLDAADRLVRAADPEGRSLLDLRKLADDAGGVVDLPGASVSIRTRLHTAQIPTDNVAGVLRGRGALADEYVVVGAHYDHLGTGLFGSRTPNRQGEIHPGADDNASGTAGLLLLAEKMREAYDALPAGTDARSVIFLAFTAEESGLNGSRFFVENTPVSLSQLTAMINMDMIGRVRAGEVTVYGTGTSPAFDEVLDPLIAGSGLKVTKQPGGQGPSDHSSFYSKDIPVLAFFSGLHEQYHTPDDEDWTVNRVGAVKVVDLVERTTLALATRPERLVFASTGTPSQMGSVRNVSVRLGIAPGNYADMKPGVMVGEVYPGTSAAEGGILAGDRIVRWNGEELADIGAMMERLADHKPGDVVPMVVVRDGREVSLNVTMKARERGSR